MIRIDEQTLQAYIDRELDADATARLDAAIATDPTLAARAAQARALRTRLREAFDPVLDEPVPARLAALLQPSATAVTAARMAGHPARARRAPGHGRKALAALAASLVLVAGVWWWWAPHDPLIRTQGGQAVAGGALEQALDQALASAPQPHAPVAIGLTFRAADGQLCRTFTVHVPPERAGLACRQSGHWSLPVVAPASAAAAGGELRQASSEMPPAVQAAVDARLRGDVFDAAQERAARDAGWR